MTEYRGPVLENFEWQQAVADRVAAPVGGEAKGYRYLITTGTGDFTGEDGNIATAKQANPSQASHWYFDDKAEGMMVYVKGEDEIYQYITSWSIYKDLSDIELDIIRNNDNIMLNAFRIAINGSLTQFNMIDGIVDEYEDESGIDTVNSTGELYNSTDDYYGPTPGSSNPDIKLLLNANGTDASRNPYAHYKCNDDAGDTVVTDYGSGENNGVANVNTSNYSVVGKINDAFEFNGSTEYVGLENLLPDIRTDTTGSVSVWIYCDNASDPSVNSIFTAGDIDGDNLFSLGELSNKITFSFLLGGTILECSTPGNSIPDNATWYHVVLVQDGVAPKMYINGINQTISYINQTDKTAWFNTVGTDFDTMRLAVARGASYHPSEPRRWFDGRLDDFRYYQHVLSQNEIDFIYNSSSGTEGSPILDSSDSSHLIKSAGTAQLDTAEKYFGSASLLFDGDSDYLTIPDSSDWDLVGSNSDNWTIDLWVKHVDHAGYEHYIGQYQDATNKWNIQHGDSVGIRFKVQSTGGDFNTGWNGEITDTNWHHIALCKIADEYGIYLDGVQVNYVQSAIIATFNGDLTVGYENGSLYFDGHLDDIRISHAKEFTHSAGAPNVGLTDTINVPTSEHTVTTAAQNMVLISDSFTAEAQPDSARIIFLEEDVDSITLNTDIKAYVSRDGGTTYTQVTLVDEGNYDSSKRILAASIDISGQPSGTNMEYKIETLNEKDLKLHATGLSWDS